MRVKPIVGMVMLLSMHAFAAHAIEGLLALGYPPEKTFYYRGGMQAWLSVGLTTVKKGD